MGRSRAESTTTAIGGPGLAAGVVAALVTAVGVSTLLGEAVTWTLGVAWATGLGTGVAVAVGILAARQRAAAVTSAPALAVTDHALAASGDGFWDLDLRRTKVRYSERCATMLGYDPSDVEDTLSFWGRLVHPDDLPAARRSLDAHVEGETEVYEIAVRLRGKDGRWHWVLDRGRVVERDGGGAAIRAVGVHRLLPGPPDETAQTLLLAIGDELQAVLAVFLGRRELAAWATPDIDDPFADTTFDAGVVSALGLAEGLAAYGHRGILKTQALSLADAIVAAGAGVGLDVDAEGDATVDADPALLRIALRSLFASASAPGARVLANLSIRTENGRAILSVRAADGASEQRGWRWIVARVIAERHGGWATAHGDRRTPDSIELALPLSVA